MDLKKKLCLPAVGDGANWTDDRIKDALFMRNDVLRSGAVTFPLASQVTFTNGNSLLEPPRRACF